MKKLICVILCILMSLLLFSCKNKDTVTSETTNQSVFTDESETSSDINMIISETESTTESEIPITPVESQPTVSNTSSDTISDEKTVESSSTVKQEFPEFTYNVNDPENLRCLSTERRGFSFGIAEGGVAHNQSFLNQQTFDSFENVEALALDTKTNEKIMYLTFDNGYEYKNLTANILDTLKEKNVNAAFFVTLSYVKQNPQLVRRMIDEGHIVGNHSATHPSFPSLTRTQMAQEIATLDNYLRENFSYTSPYFRFPSGEHSECALELITSIGFKSIFWSIAYSDWDTSNQKGADYAFSTVTSRFHSGAVILLHAVSQDNADALGRIIDEAHNQGYTFKTLNEYTY